MGVAVCLFNLLGTAGLPVALQGTITTGRRDTRGPCLTGAEPVFHSTPPLTPARLRQKEPEARPSTLLPPPFSPSAPRQNSALVRLGRDRGKRGRGDTEF